MSPSLRRSSAGWVAPFLEPLESRQLLSVSLPGSVTALGDVAPTPVRPVMTSAVVLNGRGIYAEAGQPFTAVIGTIRDLPPVPKGYTLAATIDWGDATPTSQATFRREPDGTIAVIGDHTYADVGADVITVVVTENPPPWTALPVRLVGTFRSSAKVIESRGGVTQTETAGVNFTDNVGTFRSSLSSDTMTAIIDWGDGTQSRGKIVALPTADPIGGAFAVYGNHTYAKDASYLVHVTVYSATPPPVVGPTATDPPIFLVADIDSVIDVLPGPVASTTTTTTTTTTTRTTPTMILMVMGKAR
jgi:hypothetical protein